MQNENFVTALSKCTQTYDKICSRKQVGLPITRQKSFTIIKFIFAFSTD